MTTKISEANIEQATLDALSTGGPTGPQGSAGQTSTVFLLAISEETIT